MVSYKDLGLVNSREIFAKAMQGGYAIPAFNFNNMEQLQAIIQACVAQKSPVILQVSQGARKYANQTMLRYMAQGAVEYAKELGCEIPIVLHLDHGDSFELCKSCIEYGFSSVMIDGSHLPYDENVALTKKVVDYAHQYDVTVEGELGVLAGVEDEVSAENSTYTRAEDVEDFVKKTGVCCLAVLIGNAYGYYKKTPCLDIERVKAIREATGGLPLVLHGGSGIPFDQVHKAVTLGVSKVNINTDDIRFNGERLKGEEKVYIVMNKPKGYVTTASDPHADKTVMDLLKGCPSRVFPVGRLDKNTTGVLMFTNDGEIAEKLTHPSYDKKKIYQVSLDSKLKQEDYEKILSGVELSDGVIAADELEYIEADDHRKLGIEIHSGKNRIVRRIFESLGYEVKALDRVYFAGLTKKGLKRGEWRFLTEGEINLLRMGAYI